MSTRVCICIYKESGAPRTFSDDSLMTVLYISAIRDCSAALAPEDMRRFLPPIILLRRLPLRPGGPPAPLSTSASPGSGNSSSFISPSKLLAVLPWDSLRLGAIFPFNKLFSMQAPVLGSW